VTIPPYDGEDLVGRIAHLLRFADPQGPAAERLRRLLTHAQDGTLLGPSALGFLASLERRTQNIECTEYLANGACGLAADLGGYQLCPHARRFIACAAYAPQEPKTNAPPLKALGLEVTP
jgi:hypothetical protein